LALFFRRERGILLEPAGHQGLQGVTALPWQDILLI